MAEAAKKQDAQQIIESRARMIHVYQAERESGHTAIEIAYRAAVAKLNLSSKF